MRPLLPRRAPCLFAAACLLLFAAACSSAGTPPSSATAPAICAAGTPKAGATVSRAFVCVDAPRTGAAVGSSIDVTGRAANAGGYSVSVELLDGSGLIAARGQSEFPNATAPARVATWHVTMNVPTTVEAGPITLVVRAFDTSQRTFGEDDVSLSFQRAGG